MGSTIELMLANGRLLSALTAVAIIAGGCASTIASETSEPLVGAVLGDLSGRSTATPTPSSTTPPATTTPPASTTPPGSTSTIALDPYETQVATVKPEVSILHTFEQPDGEPVRFEFPLTNPTYFDNDLVLMVIDESDDDRWLKVQIPVRPNGTEAWIRSADVTLSTHRYRAEINLTGRSVKVWDGDDLVVDTGAVIGAESSPTPIGSFYVNELVTKWEGSAYGPYILSLSAFSEALETFNGGIPVIAIHGTNRPELIGGAYSNGCIRIPNEVVAILAEIVPMGTPVDIVA